MDLHDKSPYKARKISLWQWEAELKAEDPELFETYLEVLGMDPKAELEAELKKPAADQETFEAEALETMLSMGDGAPPGSNDSLTGHPTVKAQPFDKQYIHDKSPPSYVGCTSQPSQQDSSVVQPSNGRVYCSPPHGDPAKSPVTDHPVIPEAAADENFKFIIEKSSNVEHVVSEAKRGGRVFKISSSDSTLHRKLQLLDGYNRRVEHVVCALSSARHKYYVCGMDDCLTGQPGCGFPLQEILVCPTIKAQLFDKQYTHDKSPPSDVGCTFQLSHQDISVGKMDLHDKSLDKARKKSLQDVRAVMEACEADLQASRFFCRGDEAPPGSNDSLTGHPTVKAQPFDKQYIHDKSPPSDVGCTSQPSHQDSSVGQPSNGHVYCSPPHGDPAKRPVTDHPVIDQEEFTGRDPVNPVIPEAAADEDVKFIIEKSSNGEYVVSEAKCGGRVFKISSCDSTLHRKLQLLDDDNRRVAKLYFHNLSNRCDVYIYSGSNKKKDSSISWDQNELHVTLLNGSSGGICDYKVTENMTDKSCVIYKGNSSTIIAQTCPQEGNKLMLQIDPDEDLSRVLSMIVAVGAMHSPSKLSAAGDLAANLLKTLAGGAIFGLGKDLTDGGGCLGGFFS